MALTTQQVETLYLAYLGRKGYAEEVAGWQTLEITQESAATGFYNSPEAQARGLTDNATYINQIYNDLFNRDAETAGLNGWLQVLASGFPRDQIALAIANAALSNPSGADAQTLQAAISDVPPGSGPAQGDTFMLTEGVDYADADKSTHDGVADTFKFTDASEKITATFAQLNKGDQLIDLSNADNDTLALSLGINDVKQTIGSKNGATLVNIEELDITSRGAKNITFDNTISAAGLKTIKIAGAFLNEKGNDGNGFTFSGNVLKTLTTVDASAITAGNVNIDASKATQDLTITGSNFAASINGGFGDDTITGQGTISAGAGDDIITITGKSSVTGGEGKDTFDVQAGKVTITDLGVGKDIIKVAAAAEVTANVGTGWTATADSTNDGILTLNLAGDAKVNLAELAGNKNVNLVVASGTGFATVTGFTATELTYVGSGAELDIIGFGEEGVIIDISKADVDENGGVSIKGTAGDDEITTAATGSTTVDAKAGNDIINAYAADSIDGGAGDDWITAYADSATINGGAGDDGITAYANATIDGGDGNDTINVYAGGSIKGGAGNDTIDASAATDDVTIEGGAGNDAISLGAGKDTVVFSSKSSADANTITNFTVANDKLSFDKTAFNGFNSAADTITDVSSSATAVDTANNTAIFRGTFDNLKANLKAAAQTDNNKVVIAIATDVGNEGIYSVTLKHSGGGSADASDIVKVGTLDVVNLSTLTIDNFIAGV